MKTKETKFKMKYWIKAKWLKALRSGEYHQITNQLSSHTNTGAVGHCCLGVLESIQGSKRVAGACRAAFPSTSYRNGLSYKGCVKLSELNDSSRLGFKAIANWIDKNVHATR